MLSGDLNGNEVQKEGRYIHIYICTHTYICILGFPGISVGKESACNAGDSSSIPGLGRSAGEGKGYPLQYSGQENSMDCIVHGVANSLSLIYVCVYI